jgi:hypothetical protein
MMHGKSYGRTIALAGTVALTLAGSTVLAAIAPQTQAATPVRPGRTCTNSSSVQQLALMDKSDDGDFQCLGVSLENGAIKAIRLETHHFVAKDQQSDQEQIKIEEFPSAVIESSRGAVLDGIPGHDAIVLRGHFSTPPSRSEFVASFLYNGFTGEYHSCQIALDHAPGVGWRMVDRFDQTVSHILVRTRLFPVIGAFGIANLEGACT